MATGIVNPVTQHGQHHGLVHARPMDPEPIHYRGEPDSVMVKLNNPTNFFENQAFFMRCLNVSERFIVTLDSPGIITISLRHNQHSDSSEVGG